LFICLQPAEPILGTRGSSGAALSQKVGAGAQVIRGGPGVAPSREAGAGAMGIRDGPGAAPSQEAGAGATRHVAALELPRAERWEPLS
jgi:hypothetical protein